MDASTMWRLGAFLAQRLREEHPGGGPPRVAVARDTRESGKILAGAFGEGLREAGGDAHLLGVLPTAGLAFLTRSEGFQAGAMVTASHNPWEDNGIKIFSPDGFKLSDEDEAAVEAGILAGLVPSSASGGALRERPELAERYAAWLASQVSMGFKGRRVVLDCAHGAASVLAPELFRRLGFEARSIASSPDGRNINLGCGAVHSGFLREAVLREKAEWGVCLDGDADRAIFVTASGRVADGDEVLYLLAGARRAAGRLAADTVVGTVMSNAALEAHFRREGIAFARSAVGDRYVLQELQKRGAELGGEPSGHILMLDLLTTGSGILTALKVAECLARQGQSFDEALTGFVKFPQTLKSYALTERRPLESLPLVRRAVAEAEKELESLSGRVLVRYSGTEPKVRLMAESPDAALNDRLVEAMARAFRGEGLLA
jgi:phosphoglucosamine mutase